MMRSLDGLAWTARWMVRFRGMTEEAGIRGGTWKRTGWGKDSRVVRVQGGNLERQGTVVPGSGECWDSPSSRGGIPIRTELPG